MAREHIDIEVGSRLPFTNSTAPDTDDFFAALKRCAEGGDRIAIDGMLPSGTTIHAFARRVAIDPVTNVAAIAVVILSVG